MRRLALLAAAGAIGLVVATGAASVPIPPPHDICVGKGPNCLPTLATALATADDGDTIQLGPGTYQGGVTIAASIDLVGAGADKTKISGGGPVLTIGELHAATEPTVALRGLTITGGVTTSSFDTDGARAAGGGIQIPPNAACTGGATVTISDSVIDGNSAAPADSGTDAAPCPGPVHLSLAEGGGIYSAGTLTLTNTTVSGNTAGGDVASTAWGGGILSTPSSSLTIVHSVVSDNEASASDPNGVQATGGGILAQTGAFTITDSVVAGNRATLSSMIGSTSAAFQANSAGIQCDRSATITGTRIDGNVVTVTDPNGGPAAFDAAFDCGSVVLRNADVSGNRVIAEVADTSDSGPDGGALEFDGPSTIAHTRVTGNSATVTTVNGFAQAIGAVSAFDDDPTTPATISDSEISANTISATSAHGSSAVQAGGIANNGLLELRNVRIRDNSGTATGPGPDGFAQGGGVWNGDLFGSTPLGLTLDHTNVQHNNLSASPGNPVQGAGLYTVGFPVTLTHSHIDHNTPDDCVGC